MDFAECDGLLVGGGYLQASLDYNCCHLMDFEFPRELKPTP